MRIDQRLQVAELLRIVIERFGLLGRKGGALRITQAGVNGGELLNRKGPIRVKTGRRFESLSRLVQTVCAQAGRAPSLLKTPITRRKLNSLLEECNDC